MPVLISHYGSHHTKPVYMGIFKICMVTGKRTVFSPPGSLHRGFVKVGYGPKCARASFKTLTKPRCNKNIIAVLTAGLRNKSSIRVCIY